GYSGKLDLTKLNQDLFEVDNDINVKVNKETHDIGIQVFDNMLHTPESYIYLLQAQLDMKINEIGSLKKQLEYAYDYVIES
ncbi:7960_t:CDS:2, partial [Racocetra fulgida]